MSEDNNRNRKLDVSVGSGISKLQSAFLGEDPAARATLAQLRLAVDEEPGLNPRVWERVMAIVPESYAGWGDEPSNGEWAAHLALTFYAVHQQGNTRPMHDREVSFGAAVGALMRERPPSTKARYDAALMATTFRQQRYHLRSLIGLLKADGIALDYGRFANDLFLLQIDEFRPGVIRRWGRDFYRSYSRAPKKNLEPSASSTN